MNIPDWFPMKKQRLAKTPKRSPSDTARQPCVEQSGLEIMWDNQSPSPGAVYRFGKRKKNSEVSSGEEITDLVRKLADKSGTTPEANPLVKFWRGNAKRAALKPKNSTFVTPARRPRRAARRRTKVKQLSKELELLAHHMNEPEEDEHAGKGADVHTASKDDVVNHVTNLAPAEPVESEEVDLFDVWESDSSDELLSQIDMAITGDIPAQATQVFTHTQILGSEEMLPNTREAVVQPQHTREAEQEDSIVTETWDFTDGMADSDGEEFLLTAMDDFEKSQNVSTVRPRISESFVLSLGPVTGTESCTSGNALSNLGSAMTNVGQCQNSLNKGSSFQTIDSKHRDNLTGSFNWRSKHVSKWVDKAEGSVQLGARRPVTGARKFNNVETAQNQVYNRHSVTGRNSNFSQKHLKH